MDVGDERIEAALRRLLDARAEGASLCPSEVARLLSPSDWRALMPRVREVAARLARSGGVAITQRGRVVDPTIARGPIRIRRR